MCTSSADGGAVVADEASERVRKLWLIESTCVPCILEGGAGSGNNACGNGAGAVADPCRADPCRKRREGSADVKEDRFFLARNVWEDIQSQISTVKYSLSLKADCVLEHVRKLDVAHVLCVTHVERHRLDNEINVPSRRNVRRSQLWQYSCFGRVCPFIARWGRVQQLISHT